MEVANVVKYTFKYLPPYEKVANELEHCNYVTISELAAILRIANILDKSHRQKIKDMNVTVKAGKLVITVSTFDEITLEAGLFESRAAFFEQVFGLVPELRVKRSGKI
jgi:exopolyphosphatase/guanosine-5'-triphosphate,3'-diphosphate pyrophosphatase